MPNLRSLRARRGRGERGAALVEFAFVAPILFLLMFVLADFALAELSDTAGANAAREGARVGIIYYEDAHNPSDTDGNYDRIADAVAAKLADNVEGTPTVSVRCLEENGTARPGSGSCGLVGTNTVDVGEDLIEVTVTWTRKGGITGFVTNKTRTERAQMTIVGTPPDGAPAPISCQITASSAAPSTVTRSGSTIPDVTYSVTVNDASICGAPTLALPTGSGYTGVQTMTLLSGTTFTYVMDGSNPAGHNASSWTSGTKTATATAGGVATAAITFQVIDPATCLITAAGATPSSLPRTTANKLSAAITFSVTVNNIPACGTPTLAFPASTGVGTRTTTGSGPTYTYTLPATDGTWTTQTYTITAFAGGDTEPISVIVTDPPTCTFSNLTVSPNPAAIKSSNGQNRDDITISVIRSSTDSAVCPAPSVAISASSPASASGATTCAGTVCTRQIDKNTSGWGTTLPSSRTVTVTGSGTVPSPTTLSLVSG